MAYSRRYAGGFVNKPATTTPIDQQFLNAVEDALMKLNAVDPTTDGQVLQWDSANTRFGPALLLNKNIDPGAAIDWTKINSAGQIKNADIAGAAAIAKSKLNLAGGIVNSDIAAAAAILGSKLDLTPVNSLPVSVTGGQLAVFVDSTAAPTYAWLMCWSAVISKWVFIGGTPAHISIASAETTASTVFTDLATVGPSFTVPAVGLYEVVVMSGHIQNSGTDDFRIGISVGGGAATEIAWANATANASNGQSMSGMARFATVGAQAIKMQYRTRSGGTHTAYNREMKVHPVTIG